MTWEEALTYDDIIKDVARDWSYRCGDESLEEDIAQHVYMMLVRKVKTEHAINKEAFVRAAAWRIAYKFATSKRYGVNKNLSLELMESWGYQVDEYGNVRLPDYTVRFENEWEE